MSAPPWGEQPWILALGLALPVGTPATAVPFPPAETRAQAETCLAQAVSYEAGTEPAEGRAAVAQVVLNRLRDPGFPKTVCGVVFQGSERRTGCQFTFTCDGSLVRRRPVDWENAVRIARGALDGTLPSDIGDATHYHAVYVQPAWAAQLTPVRRIGAHIFYAASLRAGRSGPGPLPAAGIPVVATPQPSGFSPWGIRTAVLLPGRDGVRVAPVPSPSFEPGTAGRAFP
jgi:hypothetical protein